MKHLHVACAAFLATCVGAAGVKVPAATSSQSRERHRTLHVDVKDGLEDKMEPNEVDHVCDSEELALVRSDISRFVEATLHELGKVMDKTVDGGEERLLLFVAQRLVQRALHFDEAIYLTSCRVAGCRKCLTEATGGGLTSRQDPAFSLQKVWKDFERMALAFCDIFDDSAYLARLLEEKRREQATMISRVKVFKELRRTLDDISSHELPAKIEEQARLEAEDRDESLLQKENERGQQAWAAEVAKMVSKESTTVSQGVAEALVLGRTLAATVYASMMDMLEIIPIIGAEARHMPGGYPAYRHKVMDAFLHEGGNLAAADLQETLFLRQVPHGGWPAQRSSALCDDLLPPETPMQGVPNPRSVRVRQARTDAIAHTTWLGAKPHELLQSIREADRPVYNTYVSVRNAHRFNQHVDCEDAVGLLFDPAYCLEEELGLGGIIYYANADLEQKDQLYVQWVGPAWAGQRSEERPVWEAFFDPMMAPLEPIDIMTLSPMAGNCKMAKDILQAESMTMARIVYVPINPLVPPPLEVEPNYTNFFVWNRRKTKAGKKAGQPPEHVNREAVKRHLLAQCSLQTVIGQLQPMGYQLLFLEHVYAVFAHQNVASLLRRKVAGRTGVAPLAAFEAWRQGWYCSPLSRYIYSLEAGGDFDESWLSPDGKGDGEKGLGCIPSFRHFLEREGHAIAANYTGKFTCSEEALRDPPREQRTSHTEQRALAPAVQRRLRALWATAAASAGLASAQTMGRDVSPSAIPTPSSMWCSPGLAGSTCVCVPPFRGSRCDVVDRSQAEEAHLYKAAIVYVLVAHRGSNVGETKAIEALERSLSTLWTNFNSLKDRDYPVIIFHRQGLEDEVKERLALASDNRVWFFSVKGALGKGAAAALRWFRSSSLFKHPVLEGIDLVWSLTPESSVFSSQMQDPFVELQSVQGAVLARHQRQSTKATGGGALVKGRKRLVELIQLFLLQLGYDWQAFEAAGGASMLFQGLAEGGDAQELASECWRRDFLAGPASTFRLFVEFLEAQAGGEESAANSYDPMLVQELGAAVAAFLVEAREGKRPGVLQLRGA